MDTTTLTTAQADAMKQYGVRVVDGVATEPVTLDEARLQLKIVADSDGSPHDPWIEQIGLPAAREWCEGYSGLSIGLKTLELATNGFPLGGIPLPFGPVTSIVSVTFIDGEGTEVAMAEDDYYLDQFTERLLPSYGTTWPTALDFANSVRVVYNAGYEADSDGVTTMPYRVKAAVLLTLGHLDVNREDTSPVVMNEIPTGAKNFLDQVRIRLGMA
jgi:uncharacterized phiE125 gp8 family phage protein